MKKIEAAIKNPSFNWLGRKIFIEDFSKYILLQKDSTHVCINGTWGSGKTTTVLGIIDNLNRLQTEQNEKILMLYLDAWKYEHYDHPLYALLKVMQESIPDISSKIKSEFERITAEYQTGLNLSVFSFSFSSKDDSDQKRILNMAEYVDALNELMINAIKSYKEEKGNQLIIFIDELDRAKPDFALKMLEMFHHIQDELPTHVIYSVDMNQLNSIIKHYYGFEYNVEIFVHKVFDVIIPLGKISKQDIKAYIINQLSIKEFSYDKDSVANILVKYMKSEQIDSLRTINKLCQKTITNLDKGYFKSSFTGSMEFYSGMGFNGGNLWGYVELLIILEIISVSDPLLVQRLLSGRDIDKLTDYILESNNDVRNSKLFNLIYDAFIYDIEKEKIIRQKSTEMDQNDITQGIRKIINHQTGMYGDKRFFDSFDL